MKFTILIKLFLEAKFKVMQKKVFGKRIDIGETIKYYRNLNHLSQAELGKKIKSDARTISNYEKGKNKPSIDTIVLLARALEVSADKLLIDTPYKEKKISFEEKEASDMVKKVYLLSKEEKDMVKNLVDFFVLQKKSLQRNYSQ